MRNNWSAYSDFDSVCRRAGGRRAYNAARQAKVAFRRLRVAEYLFAVGFFNRGVQATLAHALGVSRSTISKDATAILALGWSDDVIANYHVHGWTPEHFARRYYLSRREARERFAAALRHQCLVLRLRDGLSDASIADRLRLPESVVGEYLDGAVAERDAP